MIGRSWFLIKILFLTTLDHVLGMSGHMIDYSIETAIIELVVYNVCIIIWWRRSEIKTVYT